MTGVSHIDLTVSDAERSAAWYVESLGLERILDPDSADLTFPGRVINLIAASGRVIISVVEHDRAEPGAFSEFRVGLDHLALAVETRSDLEEWVEHFHRIGVAHSEIADMPYGSVLVFRDPDGIQLELFAYTPSAQFVERLTSPPTTDAPSA
jgi:catechol-2,3-dioxygenase